MDTLNDSNGTALIIAAAGTAIAGVLGAISTIVGLLINRKVNAQKHHLSKQDATLDRVENQTNGNLTNLTQELATSRREVAELKAAAAAKAEAAAELDAVVRRHITVTLPDRRVPDRRRVARPPKKGKAGGR